MISLHDSLTMPDHIKSQQLWIGLIEVRPLGGCEVFDDTRGAFTNVVTWAADASEYGRKAASLMEELLLFIVSIENPEPVGRRRARQGSLEESIDEIVSDAELNPQAVVYDTFYTYEKADA